LALFGGEDYELLFTAAPAHVVQLTREIHVKTGTRVTVIGEIAAAAEGRMLVLPGGRAVPLRAGGWDHLKKE
jgi:thiamine-monophosphate kinase